MLVKCKYWTSRTLLLDMERVSTRMPLSSSPRLCSTGWNRGSWFTNYCSMWTPDQTWCTIKIQRVNLNGGGSLQILFHLNLKLTSSRSSRWACHCHLLLLAIGNSVPDSCCSINCIQKHKNCVNLVGLNFEETCIKDNCFREHHVSVSCEVYPDTGTVELWTAESWST